MLKIKKVVLLQNISLALGVIAFCLSIFILRSICSINEKLSNLVDVGINGKVFKPIKDIPDVEIINNDGSVTKVHAKESNDELSKIIDVKREKSNLKKSTNISNGKVSGKNVKDDKKQQNNYKNKNNKPVVPVSRNLATIKEKPQQTQQFLQNKQTNKNNVVGDFVVQIGAFKDKVVAEKQCQKARPSLEGKRCGVVAVNEQTFRAVVYPFTTNENAIAFANRLTNVLGSPCIAKKNG